jgi:hypothetical protein
MLAATELHGCSGATLLSQGLRAAAVPVHMPRVLNSYYSCIAVKMWREKVRRFFMTCSARHRYERHSLGSSETILIFVQL